jgi:hypothetical protein
MATFLLCALPTKVRIFKFVVCFESNRADFGPIHLSTVANRDQDY